MWGDSGRELGVRPRPQWRARLLGEAPGRAVEILPACRRTPVDDPRPENGQLVRRRPGPGSRHGSRAGRGPRAPRQVRGPPRRRARRSEALPRRARPGSLLVAAGAGPTMSPAPARSHSWSPAQRTWTYTVGTVDQEMVRRTRSCSRGRVRPSSWPNWSQSVVLATDPADVALELRVVGAGDRPRPASVRAPDLELGAVRQVPGRSSVLPGVTLAAGPSTPGTTRTWSAKVSVTNLRSSGD